MPSPSTSAADTTAADLHPKPPTVALQRWKHRVPVIGSVSAPALSKVLARYVYRPSIRTFRSSGSPRPGGRFAELFFGHQGRRVEKWVHYCEIYDRLFGPFVDGFPRTPGQRRPLRFLEIGTYHGGSLEIWREYFGPDATIYGIDVDPRCATVGRPDLQVRIGSQDDPEFLRAVVEEMGGIDIVLDDGSHVASHQRVSFDTLFPLLSTGGLYVVEDTHSAYWAGYGGGLRRPGSFISVAKSMVDGMHKWYFRAPVGRRAAQARTDIVSIQFFDSIVAIEKGKNRRPEFVTIGTPSF